MRYLENNWFYLAEYFLKVLLWKEICFWKYKANMLAIIYRFKKKCRGHMRVFGTGHIIPLATNICECKSSTRYCNLLQAASISGDLEEKVDCLRKGHLLLPNLTKLFYADWLLFILSKGLGSLTIERHREKASRKHEEKVKSFLSDAVFSVTCIVQCRMSLTLVEQLNINPRPKKDDSKEQTGFSFKFTGQLNTEDMKGFMGS